MHDVGSFVQSFPVRVKQCPELALAHILLDMCCAL
jgi:hypothetical protein